MTIDDYFEKHGFNPNDVQREAILHTAGPLLLVAGPGSGKTRVLLWRTFNLIVCHDVQPRDIFLSTFTEKAARQLKDGLLTLLGSVPGQYFDTSEMYVGTVHSLCRRILTDRRFNLLGAQAPELMDEVDQYFHVYDSQFWKQAGNTEKDVLNELKPGGFGQSARHRATIGLISLFNRLSEECITPQTFHAQSAFLSDMYQRYLDSLETKTDMSLLQQRALKVLQANTGTDSAFKYLLIDEYQDTNTVQERIYFSLANQTKNLCVVGDDDQALYRFRGATVENLVQFSERCQRQRHFQVPPHRIDLVINYRSRPQIVDFYNHFIQTDINLDPNYRLAKVIAAARLDNGTAVVVTQSDDDLERCDEIAGLVKQLLDGGKVADPNQIAFLYPSVKSPLAKSMIEALARQGLSVHSPRSGRFLDCQEAKLIFGLMLQVLGRPDGDAGGAAFAKFNRWLDECEFAALEMTTDEDDEEVNELKSFITSRKDELEQLNKNHATDWNLLDLFYQFCASETISSWLTAAEQGGDEGQACNLSLVSQYLFRYQQKNNLSVIRQSDLGANGDSLSINFFNSYLYGLFRLEESEYEDTENPFPKGRIPFLTIHQAKGLEFPVVVLGSLNAFPNRPTKVEEFARAVLSPEVQASLEPLNLIAQFDAMRMFYVALSRAENLLILANTKEVKAKDKRHPGLATLLDNGTVTKIEDYDLAPLPIVGNNHNQPILPKIFSYTADYQYYLACPRQYMLFRKYGFAPSRTRTMAFGILVHKTIEDIHRRLIDTKQEDAMEAFIKQRFDENYQILSSESSHKLAPHTLEAAHQQVIHYWGKLSHLAKTITNTEVPLTLPGQQTPEGVPYSIHGVVDMAMEGEQSQLFDIKTHDADFVRANPGYYQEQLNVYAHIWQTLHEETLSGTSIIATKLPADTRADTLAEWNPVISLPFNQPGVDETIQHFGQIVDYIESRQFQPRSSDDLSQTSVGAKGAMFDEVCSTCDGRFSCSSYAGYLEQNPDKKPKDKPIFLPIYRDDNELQQLGHLYLEPEKDEYLNDVHVGGFIRYLSDMVIDVNPQILNHNFTVEPVNKHFLDTQIREGVQYPTIQDAFDGYVWNKLNYAENQLRLTVISNNLRGAGTENDLYQACLECLEWGAGGKQFKLYTANRDWLWVRKRQVQLSVLLDNSKAQLSSTQPDMIGFKYNHYRMNSGFTKIYALKYDNFIIYDSRVAAALGLLVRRYCQQNQLGEVPPNLAFHWSGTQKRNPSFGNYTFSRLNNNSRKHAEWNIKANWILNAVVNGLGTFWGLEGNERLRALEAALFMIGYSVAENAVENEAVEQPIAEEPTHIEVGYAEMADDDEVADPSLRLLWNVPIRQGIINANNGNLDGGWVPTSHNFTAALELYLSYRQTQPNPPTRAGFNAFMMNLNMENLYVQNSNEFDLNHKDASLIQSLWNSQGANNIMPGALMLLGQYRQRVINAPANQPPEIKWNKFPKYLMDTYLCGQLAHHSNSERKAILEAYKYAGIGNGNGSAAQAIFTVGRSFGTHFGFLDENYYPTLLFEKFFMTTDLLENWIDDVTDN